MLLLQINAPDPKEHLVSLVAEGQSPREPNELLWMQQRHDNILWHTFQQYGGSPGRSNPGYSEQFFVKMYCTYMHSNC